ERVSSLGTAISAISKNVKTRKDIINQADLSRVKYQFRLGLTRLIDSFGALGFSSDSWVSASVFGCWIGIGFYFIDIGFGSCTARWIDVGLISGLDSWMLDRCWLRFFNLGYWLCWIG
ncbi:hypothetical protein RhiirB3_451400, partial [Rhizophagus irregularis]